MADSLPTIPLMILSIAATSVPQFGWAEAFSSPFFAVSVGVAALDELALSRFARCFFSCSTSPRSFAGTDIVLISLAASCAFLRWSCGVISFSACGWVAAADGCGVGAGCCGVGAACSGCGCCGCG